MFLLLFGFLLTSSPSLFMLSLKLASHSRGVSVENLPGRGFGATCCACVSFAWEIVRDSPMVNFDSQTMNKHIKLVIGGEVYVAWKCKMHYDVIGGHQAYNSEKERFIYLWSLEFHSWLRPHAVRRLPVLCARQDYKVATLGTNIEKLVPREMMLLLMSSPLTSISHWLLQWRCV